MTEWLTTREVGRRLSVHPETVREWCRKGVLRSVRLPGGVERRIRADEVDRVMAAGAEVVELRRRRTG